jgi:hypothetical protein
MWGGDIESEAAWVFDPKLLFYETEITHSEVTVRSFNDQGSKEMKALLGSEWRRFIVLVGCW